MKRMSLAVIASISLASFASAQQEPSWPQGFEVQGPESASFGFAVTQPGPITIEVQWQGPPIRVSLEGPNRTEQVGRDRVVVSYNVTPQDVQRGALWGVRLALETPAAVRAAGRVIVQHPGANPQIVQAQLTVRQQAAAQQQARASSSPSPDTLARTDAQLRAHVERTTRASADRQVTLLRASQAAIDQQRLRRTDGVRTRAIASSGAAVMRQSESPRDLSAKQTLPPSTQSSSQAIEAATPPPPPQQVVLPPTIASLSVSRGSPGVPPVQPTPVIITGSGFTDQQGEVRFIVNPGVDLPAPVDWWTDGLIRAYVPAPPNHGITAFDGFVYVVRKPDNTRSGAASFRFEPALETRSTMAAPDRRIAQPGLVRPNGLEIWHHNGNPFWGTRGNDEFFPNTRLQNGWVLEDVYLYQTNLASGGSYIADKKVGTDWPYFNVRWWVDGSFGHAESMSDYLYQIVIRGPKGVPDGVIVK